MNGDYFVASEINNEINVHINFLGGGMHGVMPGAHDAIISIETDNELNTPEHIKFRRT